RIIYQATAIHRILGLSAELGATCHCRSQQVARRDLRNSGPLLQKLRLGTLARAGRAQQDDAHGCLSETAADRQHKGSPRYRRVPPRSNRFSAPASRLLRAVRYSSAMKKTAVRNAFYAQSGGVSAVINASACGVIETARRFRQIGRIYAGRDG